MNLVDLFIRDFISGWFGQSPKIGRLLDLGCGEQPYLPFYRDRTGSIVLLDYERRGTGHSGAFVRASAESLPFATASFDVVVCTEVLEHVPSPQVAAAELARVLVPGGTLLLTVPFLHGLHEVPRDYFRFTPWGLRILFEESFLIERIVSRGGVLAVWTMAIAGVLDRMRWAVGRLLPREARAALADRTSLLAMLYMAGWRVAQKPKMRAALDLLAIPEVSERSTLGYMCVLRRRSGAR